MYGQYMYVHVVVATCSSGDVMMTSSFCSEDVEESGEPNYLESEETSGYLIFHKVRVTC